MTLDLYPAIDIFDGKVVRLAQGDYDAETVYGNKPSEVAKKFVDEGARWIHIVDLNAARGEGPVNRPVLLNLVRTLDGRAQVQTGGGVRTVADAAALADGGISRVVMGSAAIRQPGLVSEVAAVLDVAVGLDHNGGAVATDGWTSSSELTVDRALDLFPAASAFVVTDINRDGMLSGPDIEGLRRCTERTSTPVIASGGISSLADIRALRDIPGLAGVITGKALYEHRFTVAEAIAEVNL